MVTCEVVRRADAGQRVEIGPVRAARAGIAQPIEVVRHPRQGALGNAFPDPAPEPGRVVGPHPDVFVHVEDHRVGPRYTGGSGDQQVNEGAL